MLTAQYTVLTSLDALWYRPDSQDNKHGLIDGRLNICKRKIHSIVHITKSNDTQRFNQSELVEAK